MSFPIFRVKPDLKLPEASILIVSTINSESR